MVKSKRVSIPSKKNSDPQNQATHIQNSGQQIHENDNRFIQLLEIIQKQSVYRNPKEIKLICQFLKLNKLFNDFSFIDSIIKQISASIILIFVKDSAKIDYSQNQIILIFKGFAFEYVQSFYEGVLQKIRKNSNNINPEYALTRKLKANQYFTSYIPQQKYNSISTRKMHVIVQSGGIIGKISEQQFFKFFQKRMDQHMLQNYRFLRVFDIMKDLKKNLIYEISKYLQRCKFPSSSIIYKKGDISDYFYFIKSGNILLKQEPKNSEKNNVKPKFIIQQTMSANHASQNLMRTLLLGPNNIFGVDGIILNISAEFRQYTAEAVSQVELYKIDKRSLIVLISSYNQIQNQIQIKYNEINLGDQINQKYFQSTQKQTLLQNVRKIQTSEKKIRDIKLRSLESAKFRKISPSISHRQSRQNTDDFGDLFLRNLATPMKKVQEQQQSNLVEKANFSEQSDGEKIQINNYQSQKNLKNQEIQNTKQATIHAFVMSPLKQSEEYQFFNSKSLTLKKSPVKRNNSAKNVFKGISEGKINKQQSKLIFTYLSKRRNQQLQSKLKLTTHNKILQKNSNMVKVKRLFMKNDKNKNEGGQNEELEQTLYNKMQNLTDNPLLFQIQSKRKRFLENKCNLFLKTSTYGSKKNQKISKAQQIKSTILIQD